MPTEIAGTPLRPNVAIQQEYVKAVLTMVRRMGDETKKMMRGLFESYAADAMAMDDNRSAQARILLNALMQKYEPLFNRIAKKATKRMVSRTLKNSAVTLGMSLKEMSANVSLKTDLMNGRLQELVTAGTNEAVSLIRLIPQKYLGDVQGAVMRSITTGQGLKELVPYLNKKYDQNVRHARNVAMDQTRKVFSSVNTGRMQALGMKQFQWLHVGGSTHPRELHKKLHGGIYEIDNPPVIQEDPEVRGMPAFLPFCRCIARPIISFD